MSNMEVIFEKFLEAVSSLDHLADYNLRISNALSIFSQEEQFYISNQLNETIVGWKYFLNIPNDGTALVIEDPFGTISLSVSKFFKNVFNLNLSKNKYLHTFFKQRTSQAEFVGSIIEIHADLSSGLPFRTGNFNAVIVTAFFNTLAKPAHCFLISEAKRVLADDGTLILLVQNRFSYNYLKNIKHLNVEGRFFKTYSLSGYKKLLRHRAYKSIEVFKMIPEYYHCNEIQPVLRPFQYKIKEPKTLKTKIKYSSTFNPTFLLKASKVYFESSFLNNVIEKIQNRDDLLISKKLKLYKMHIKPKGNVILHLKANDISEKGLIVKIPNNPCADTHNVKNYHALKNIHANNNFSKSFRSLVPLPILHDSYQERPYFVESEVLGVTANSLCRHTNKINFILEESINFIKLFNKNNFSSRILATEDLEQLISSKFSALSPVLDSDFLSDIFRHFKNIFSEIQIPLVLLHGDFCFSNLMLHSNSLRLKGIIDWDNYSEAGLPLLDIFTLFCSKYRLNGKNNIGDVMIDIFLPARFSLYEHKVIRDYMNDFSINDKAVIPLLILFWLDHINSQLEYDFIKINAEWINKNISPVVSYIELNILK